MKSNLFFYILKKINNYEELNPYLDVFIKKNSAIIGNYTVGLPKWQQSKFQILQFYIINGFLNHEQKEHIWDLFNKAQKIYLGFVKFAFLYRFKKASLFEMNKDLFYNSLDKFPKNQKIFILHENKKYIFRLTDLIQCWRKALTNSEDLFPTIQDLKNPYTNLPIKKYNLYNIYFKMHFSTLQNPFLIQEFFNLNFNKKHFETKFSIILKDIAIINYIDSGATFQELSEEIRTMFNENYEGKKPLDFYLSEKRTEELIKILRDYIYLYYLIQYSRNLKIKKLCRKVLNIEINKFVQKHTTFFKTFFDGNISKIKYSQSFKNILHQIYFR